MKEGGAKMAEQRFMVSFCHGIAMRNTSTIKWDGEFGRYMKRPTLNKHWREHGRWADPELPVQNYEYRSGRGNRVEVSVFRKMVAGVENVRRLEVETIPRDTV